MSRPFFSFLKLSSESPIRLSQRRCLSSLHCKKRLRDGKLNAGLPARRYAATATATASIPGSSRRERIEYLDDDEIDGPTVRRSRNASRESGESASVPYPKSRPRADPEPLVEHLQRLFPPLEFPDTVATQMLTHISAKEAWAGHNARLSFVGRRVLHSYLLLFLHNASQKLSRSTSLSTEFDFDQIAYKTLHTYLLGEFVGAEWDLARTMLWVPAVPSTVKSKANSPLTRYFSEDDEKKVRETPTSLKSPGLYKVQGVTVEGIMGGIFHQFGGTIAHRVFHTRLLPHILCPGTPFGLHDAFHPAAIELQSVMGGANGTLLGKSETVRQRQKDDNQSYPSILETNAQGWRTSRSSDERTEESRKRILS